MIFSDSPHYIHTNSYVYSTHTRAWRLHRDPWWPVITSILSYVYHLPNFFLCVCTAPLHSPFRQSLPMPSLTSRWPSHRTAHTRSPGPQLICTTSPGTGTSSQLEPSGLWWLMPHRNHTCSNVKKNLIFMWINGNSSEFQEFIHSVQLCKNWKINWL